MRHLVALLQGVANGAFGGVHGDHNAELITKLLKLNTQEDRVKAEEEKPQQALKHRKKLIKDKTLNTKLQS